ncbi:hypothetical protein SAMN05192541_124123 [Bradyrhizobium arachidis]|nr:hypothetical protein SAMN05192541_124123 [Bradyrhizobium arachidis]
MNKPKRKGSRARKPASQRSRRGAEAVIPALPVKADKPQAQDRLQALPLTVTLDIEKSLRGALKPIGGSKSDNWNELVVNQAIGTLWETQHESDNQARRDGILTGLLCMKPRDEFEGMLIAQMIGAHNAAMECHRRAMLPDQPFVGRSEALTQANKLSRTFAALLEGLNRHRGKGQQKVTVEHVHVHAGGQAVVGVVETQGAGGLRKLEDQPHALRSEDPEREALPIPRDA